LHDSKLAFRAVDENKLSLPTRTHLKASSFFPVIIQSDQQVNPVQEGATGSRVKP
jgi:hypothetical protein